MIRRLAPAACFLVVWFFATPAYASLVIDGFANPSSDTATLGGTNPASSTTTPLTGSIFTTRDNEIEVTGGADGSTANLVTAPCTGVPGSPTCMTASFDSSGAVGTFSVTYTGGGPHDLTVGGNDVIAVTTAFSDAPAIAPVTLAVMVTSLGGATDTVIQNTPDSVYFPISGLGLNEFPFSDFGNGVNFTTVTEVSFLFTTSFPAGDYEFLLLEAAQAVPEPHTMLLMGAGLLGLVMFRRRTPKSAPPARRTAHR